MFFIKLVALSVLSLSVVNGQGTDECPEIPETGITIGDPVPIRPEDIPAGCSDFEILVGAFFTTLIRWFCEINSGMPSSRNE